MFRKLLLISILLSMVLGFGVALALQAGLIITNTETIVEDGMPVPGIEGVEETIVEEGMPVPGMEGVEESIVTSGMPAHGFEGIEEMVVHGE